MIFYIEDFGGKTNSLSPLVLEIEFCLNKEMGMVISGFFADFGNLASRGQNIFAMMSSNYSKWVLL